MTSRNKGQVQADVPRNFWSVREFAATLGVSLDTVYRLIKDNKLACVQIAGEKRVPHRELERLMAEAYEQVSA